MCDTTGAGGGRNRPIRRARGAVRAARPTRPDVHAGPAATCPSPHLSRVSFVAVPPRSPHPNVSREEGTAPLPYPLHPSPPADVTRVHACAACAGRGRGAGGAAVSANRSCAGGDRELGLECGRARSVSKRP